MYSYKIIDTSNFIEPVTLAEAKVYCEIDTDYTYKDATLQNMVVSAREAGELITSLAFGTKTIQFTAADRYEFPFTPVQSVTSVKDQDGNLITDESLYPFYTIDGRVIWNDWYCERPWLFTVVYIAGYSATIDPPNPLPQGLKLGILKLTRTFLDHPDDIEITRSSGALALADDARSVFNRYQINPLF